MAARLRDYLYVDERRLDRYLEDFSSTDAAEKTRSVRATLSLSPSVTGEQATRYRAKRLREKLDELISHFQKSGTLGQERPYGYDEFQGPDLVLEECDAVPIIALPPALGAAGEPPGIRFWVSEWPLNPPTAALPPPGLLCMIEGIAADEQRLRTGFSHSGYTWLQSLLYHLHRQEQATLLARGFPYVPLGSRDFDIMHFQGLLRGELAIARPRPIDWLRDHGCSVGPPRRVTALYRVRVTGVDQVDIQERAEDATVSTFAYAVAIWSSVSVDLSR